ncbi:MAG: UbiA family prenyltransferase, partial [Pseudomonadota bacterium]|nr:UbiA family prenyltransferase [Pseudomonadota bacterium]
PQVVLGIAFSFGILMAFSALNNDQWWLAGGLFIANIVWTIAYDTEYAMADRADDLKIGIKSTAILFGRYDRLIIAALQLVTLIILALLWHQLNVQWYAWVGLIAAASLFGYQHWMIRERAPKACFQAFLHNHYVGMVIGVSLALHYWY